MDEVPVQYGEHAPVPPDAACEGCTAVSPNLVTDHCHKHGWVRGTLCGQCNANMALIDRAIMPRVKQASALVAFASRCPDCPAVDPAALLSLAGRTAYTWRLTIDQALTFDKLMLRLRFDVGRPELTKGDVLAAVADLAAEETWVFDLLIARMQAAAGGEGQP